MEDLHAKDFGTCEVIHIADREGDIYELYRDCNDLDEKFIVRAKGNRSINKARRREPPKEKLFDLESDTDQGHLTIEVQTNGKKKFRKAKLSIIFRDITVPPPPNKTKTKDGDNLVMVPVCAIMAIERRAPKGVEPIKWLLLTNLNTKNTSDAIEKVKWYSVRWNIEIFHKILKSGCSVEKAQFRDAAKLRKYIVFKSIVAWRLFWLTRLFEQNGDASCEIVLTSDEWHVLQKKFQSSATNDRPPNVSDVFLWIGKLGGFIGRIGDGHPGVISMWRGWMRFMTMLDDYYSLCG